MIPMGLKSLHVRFYSFEKGLLRSILTLERLKIIDFEDQTLEPNSLPPNLKYTAIKLIANQFHKT
ncbi:hypothetical protein DICPUDRAFT_156830 [Dictyostelium purpureum]|uniref:Uncharacterized protein n=1 Tax=Dictyostelium purpureum TaxID=5786 RepID=F0ZXJ6_DICPU|nr:uncharacterized protein DICPUDRAFT_156830 [Dictyostelium purpureum]EGC31327.1 hypothetical protein DICPUDRAFT_156830 [Dictyostelium purpureum]|eukprot:XP_003292136.1 hypothetical protein DICPUDRAFT_156830 [Dictyostelium purpureum]